MRTAAMPMLALAGLLGLGAGCRTKLRCYAHEQCGPNMVCTPDERCVPNLCGDGILLGAESCDDGNTAPDDGCGPTCQVERCGDGVQNGAEACDGTDLGDRTCADEGFVGGALACDGACALDRAGCHDCGNGVLDAGEACDGTDLGGLTCVDLGAGYTGGLLACSEGCDLDTSGCATCGNGVLEPTEACDDGNAEDWDGCTACAITELRVNTTTTNFQTSPAIAMAADGRFVVVWASDHLPGASMDVFYQLFDAAGVAIGAERRVNSYTTGVQAQPAVAMADDGRFVVAWYSAGQDGDLGGIFGQRFGGLGQAEGDEFPINSTIMGDQSHPSVGAAGDGSFAVVWESAGQDGDQSGVYIQRFDVLGDPIGVESRVNTTTVGSQTMPRIAMNSSGQHVVVWTTSDQAFMGVGIDAQGYQSNGVPLQGEFRASAGVTDALGQGRVALADTGHFIVSWTLYSSVATGGPDVWTRPFLSPGGAGYPVTRANEYVDSDQSFSAIAVAGNGRGVMAWTSDGQDGSLGGIYLRRLDIGGTFLGSEIQANQYTDDNQWPPAVAMADDGRFVVVWESYGQDGDFSGIYAQKFTAAGVPVGAGPW